MFEAASSKHLVSLEPPDVLHIVVRGDVSASDVSDIMTAMARAASGLGRPLALIDVSEMGAVAPEARAFAARNPPKVIMHGTAIHGASFQARLVTKLILSAIRLLSPDRAHPLVLMRTEAEARAWLEAHRRALAGDSRA